MEKRKIWMKDLPRDLYTRYSNLYQAETPSHDVVLSSLCGNPDGSKISSIPYIYCLDETELKHGNYENIFFLKVHFNWPTYGYIAEEEEQEELKCKNYVTYEEYKSEGFGGVKRYFTGTWRYVIFDPESCISNVFDVGKCEIIYDKMHSKEKLRAEEEQYNEHFSIDSSLVYIDNGRCQEALDRLMLDTLGTAYINKKRDVFCITEIARRQACSPYSVFRRLVPIIERISVCKASGCWVSTRKKDYKRLFWMSLGGLCHRDIFSFCQDVEKDPNIFIKNKNILHSNLCELTLGSEHTHCCRPLHLRLGTSRENTIHIKVRKNIEQLFDFTPKELREYAYHIYSLATIVEKQLHILKPIERKQMEKRKGNKIIIYENAEGKYVQKIIGNPHMGETAFKKNKTQQNEEKTEHDDILGLKGLFLTDDILEDYQEILENTQTKKRF